MTTIILTIIGILLAAAAALMVIFYGGDAFNSGSVGAQANTIQNIGSNVVNGMAMEKAETGKYPFFDGDTNYSYTLFVNNGRYLKERPNLDGLQHGIAQGLAPAGQASQFLIYGLAEDVCTRINKNLKVSPNSGSASTDFRMFCVPYTTPDGVRGAFFANA